MYFERCLLGVVYHEKGEHESAIHMYKTALKHFSEDKKETGEYR